MEIKKYFKLLLLINILIFSFAKAQVRDPLDPFDFSLNFFDDNVKDQDKSVEDLFFEASMLMESDPLEARTKLLTGLRKDSKHIPSLILISQYYSRHVGHYRLSMKYLKKAETVLFEQYKKPPYYSRMPYLLYGEILRQLAIVRQNLDNYEGALETLNEYQILGYTDSYFASSKAWVLFKLNRIDEAISVARKGIEEGANVGGTLNVLGILLSVSDRREEAIAVLNEALEYEKLFGANGQPATPLNNMGEVYRETFKETEALNSWQRALSLPDGCEHILPSLNIAIISIESLRLDQATRAISSFESCIAQFPLRNGEEHKALLHLAKGRIAMHQGKIDLALDNFRQGIERQQWFGKIGAHIEDLQVALYSSLSQALIKKNNHLKSTYTNSIFEKFNNLIQIIKNKIESNWFHKKVILILTEDLTDFEDLYIRHTDSFLEYPTLGAITKKIPRSTFERAINKMKANDNRQGAILYYNAYLAENYLNNGKKSKALEIFKQIINDKRSNYDLALKTHIKLLLLQQIKNSNQEYIKLTQEIFSTSPGNLRNYGLKLLVNYDNLSSQIIKKLNKTSFTLDDSNSLNLRYKISYSNSNNEHNFSFIDNNFNSVIIKTSNEDLTKAINMFVNDVFSEVSS